MTSILVVRPAPRDELNLADETIRSRFDLLIPGVSDALDPGAYVDRLVADPAASAADGVFGSQDQTMHLAVRAALCLGLPGPPPEAFMRCHVKAERQPWPPRVVREAHPRSAG